jgi:Protein of unknown function (DUF3159)
VTDPTSDSGEPAGESETPGESATLGEAVGDALRSSRAGQAMSGGAPTGHALFVAMGGLIGLAESVLPTVAFLVGFTITRDLVTSLFLPIALALIFVVRQVGAREPIGAAATGAVGIAISAILAVITGRAENNFLPGIAINAIFIVILLFSLLVRQPLLVIIVGFFLGDSREWFARGAKRRAMTIATWLWAALFAVRLAVEVPLYLLQNVSALGVARLITGVPLYAGMLWVTWLLVRTVYTGKDDGSVEATTP